MHCILSVQFLWNILFRFQYGWWVFMYDVYVVRYVCICIYEEWRLPAYTACLPFYNFSVTIVALVQILASTQAIEKTPYSDHHPFLVLIEPFFNAIISPILHNFFFLFRSFTFFLISHTTPNETQTLVFSI